MYIYPYVGFIVIFFLWRWGSKSWLWTMYNNVAGLNTVNGITTIPPSDNRISNDNTDINKQ